MTSQLITLAIQLGVIGVVVWAVWYLVQALPVPDPLGRVIRIIVMVIGIAAALILLLRFLGAVAP